MRKGKNAGRTWKCCIRLLCCRAINSTVCLTTQNLFNTPHFKRTYYERIRSIPGYNTGAEQTKYTGARRTGHVSANPTAFRPGKVVDAGDPALGGEPQAVPAGDAGHCRRLICLV